MTFYLFISVIFLAFLSSAAANVDYDELTPGEKVLIILAMSLAWPITAVAIVVMVYNRL